MHHRRVGLLEPDAGDADQVLVENATATVWARRREERRVFRDRADIVVLGDAPEAAPIGLGIPVDRIVATQAREELVRDAGEKRSGFLRSTASRVMARSSMKCI
jgi:hypothetical protein